MTVYNKLVRDRIPEIIEAGGKRCQVRMLNAEEYGEQLHEKLHEELREYQESREVLELVDIAEIIYAIAGSHGVSPQEFDTLRLDKQQERGGFEHRLFLEEVPC